MNENRQSEQPPHRFTPLMDALRKPPVLTAGLLLLIVVWAFWTTLTTMADRWSRDPQYSHGFLVPMFACALLWFRREWLEKARWEPCIWGLPLMLAGIGIRLLAIRRDIEPLDAFSLLPTLLGLVLFVGGRSVLRWSWPAVAFLAFMIPLPYFLDVALAHPLRRLATTFSTYTLQTFGYPAVAEGNIILIDELQLGIVDACSGLGMMTTFFALATALALVSSAPIVDRIVMVVSAVPIAVIANVTRIVGTGMAYTAFTSESARSFIHDLSGWLMMPFALLLLWLELRFMSKLLVARPETEPQPVSMLNQFGDLR